MGNKLLAFALLAGCYRPAPITTPSLREPEPAPHAASPVSWELDEAAAISYALAHSPALMERGDVERVAEAGIGAARAIEDPEIRVGRSADDQLLGSTGKLGVALRIKPPAPWTLDARVARARSEHDAERWVTRATSRVLTAEIRELYADLAFGEATRRLLARATELRRERDRVLEARAASGTATQVETLLAAHDLADLETTTSEIDGELARARSKLAALLGVPADQPWKPIVDAERFLEVRLGLDATKLVERAVAGDPGIAELVARGNGAGADAYEEKIKQLPSLSWVQVERATEDDKAEWSIGAALAIPLTSITGGKLAVARAEQRRYQHARERLASSIVSRTRDAVALVEATGKHARDLVSRLAPLDSQVEALLAQERAAGGDPVKILLLEERHLKSRRDLLDASYAHRRALIELERLVGSLP